MKIIRDIEEMRAFSLRYRQENPHKKIAFVPTMGFLHEGHISLLQKAKARSHLLVVSIFVNPSQFNDVDDLKKYPRDEEGDKEICLRNQVDILFMPSADQVYPPKDVMQSTDKNTAKDNYQNQSLQSYAYTNEKIFIDYPTLTSQLCGKFRRGHFAGVLWIVHNLFLWVQPHLALFGLKDFQQFVLIRQMVFDLSLPLQVYAGKLVREKSGLALSSRNSRLSPEGKEKALQISRSLFAVQDKIEKYELTTRTQVLEIWQNMLLEMCVEYADIYNPLTLQPLADNENILTLPNGYLLAVAAYVENVRLIDNVSAGKIPFQVL